MGDQFFPNSLCAQYASLALLLPGDITSPRGMASSAGLGAGQSGRCDLLPYFSAQMHIMFLGLPQPEEA